jgi:hypothetical protein
MHVLGGYPTLIVVAVWLWLSALGMKLEQLKTTKKRKKRMRFFIKAPLRQFKS